MSPDDLDEEDPRAISGTEEGADGGGSSQEIGQEEILARGASNMHPKWSTKSP
jgi:hypothetical protein